MNIVRPYLNEAQKEEQNELSLDCYKLGALLLIYQFLTRTLGYVYYLASYTYLTGNPTLSVNKALSYLQDHEKISSSTAFRMTGNISVTLVSVLITAVLAHFAFKGRLKSWIKPTGDNFRKGVVWATPGYVVGMLATTITNYLVDMLSNSGLSVPTSDFSIVQPSKAAILLQIGYVIIAAPIIEEFLYRGLVLSALSKCSSKGAAIAVSALFFGLMHGNIPQAVGASISGVLYAIVALESGSIIPSIIMHSFSNFTAELSSLASAIGFGNSDDVVGVILIVTAFVGLLIGLLICWRLIIPFIRKGDHQLPPRLARMTVFSNPLLIACAAWYVYKVLSKLIDANS